jgi:hypothetical protein
MAKKALRHITLTIFDQIHVRKEWGCDFSDESFKLFLASIAKEMKKYGISVGCMYNHDVTLTIKSYADLLNCVKISSDDSQGNHCIGHIIGKSEHLDMKEDIAAALRKIAFAPETIAPAGEFRKVCHNCGCGC